MKEMEKKIGDFTLHNDVEVLKEKRKEYLRRNYVKRGMRNKNDSSSTPELMTTLKLEHSLLDKFSRLKKTT